MDEIVYKPIGVVHSPFEGPKDVPIQSAAAKGVKGHIEVDKEYTDGLKDLEGFSHMILIYHFHLAKPFSLLVKAFLDEKLHGLFLLVRLLVLILLEFQLCDLSNEKTTCFTFKMWI